MHCGPLKCSLSTNSLNCLKFKIALNLPSFLSLRKISEMNSSGSCCDSLIIHFSFKKISSDVVWNGNWGKKIKRILSVFLKIFFFFQFYFSFSFLAFFSILFFFFPIWIFPQMSLLLHLAFNGNSSLYELNFRCHCGLLLGSNNTTYLSKNQNLQTLTYSCSWYNKLLGISACLVYIFIVVNQHFQYNISTRKRRMKEMGKEKKNKYTSTYFVLFSR